MDISTASSLQKVSSFRQNNSIEAEEQSQLTEEIKAMMHNALIEIMSSGYYTGQPGNKCL